MDKAIECCYREGSEEGVLVCGAASAHGRRRQQQDRFVLQPKCLGKTPGKNLFHQGCLLQPLIGVFDGHLSADVSEHLRQALPRAFAASPSPFLANTDLKDMHEAVTRTCLAVDHAILWPTPEPHKRRCSTLTNSFATLTNSCATLTNSCAILTNSFATDEKCVLEGGSTACFCLPSLLPDDDRILLANIGDSRAIILCNSDPIVAAQKVNDTQAKQTSPTAAESSLNAAKSTGATKAANTNESASAKTIHTDGAADGEWKADNHSPVWSWRQPLCDHTPGVEAERVRIVSAGADIEDGCVNGELSLTRAFGDRPYKRYNIFGRTQRALQLASNDADDQSYLLLDPTRQPITAMPDTAIEHLAPESLLVLCTDGITHSLSNDEITSFLVSRIGSRSASKLDSHRLADIAQDLCRHAIRCGSTDNVTALLARRRSPISTHAGDTNTLDANTPDAKRIDAKRIDAKASDIRWSDYTEGPYYSLVPSFHDAFVSTARFYGVSEPQILHLISRGKQITIKETAIKKTAIKEITLESHTSSIPFAEAPNAAGSEKTAGAENSSTSGDIIATKPTHSSDQMQSFIGLRAAAKRTSESILELQIDAFLISDIAGSHTSTVVSKKQRIE